jgi:hypothetical protein
MKKIVSLAGITVLALAISGCFTLTHEVGRGAQGGSETSKRQWYALWGLVPLGETDSQDMANGATDYTVKSEQNITDIILNIFTGIVTINSMTVTVTK